MTGTALLSLFRQISDHPKCGILLLVVAVAWSGLILTGQPLWVICSVVLALASLGLFWLYWSFETTARMVETEAATENSGMIRKASVAGGGSLIELTESVMDAGSEDAVSFFRDTPKRVRRLTSAVPSCSGQVDDRSSATGPANGVYEIIYATLMFNKPIRCQGSVELTFRSVEEGWEISGAQLFVGGTRSNDATSSTSSKAVTPIVDGFVHRKGECYWVTATSNHTGEEHTTPVMSERCMNRGLWDFDRQAVLNGEFHSGSHEGRIVRLERIGPLQIDTTDNMGATSQADVAQMT